MKIQDFILELLQKGIPIGSVEIVKDMNTIGFSVPGFSKSGTVVLFESNDKIFASARYNKTTEITNFDDLVSLAWYWYISYNDREPFKEPDYLWCPYFIEKGWLKKVVETKYKIVK